MRYLPNRERKEEMLQEVGLTEEKLFSDIPDEFLTKLEFPDPLSEQEVRKEVEAVAGRNKKLTSFLGGGLAPHFVPSSVRAITGRSEFYTAYTPYQPEISQGMLQSLFEYQSFVAELTGLPIVNSSLYDWSTSLAEAMLMSHRFNKRDDFLIADIISPQRLQVLKTYAEPLDINIKTIGHQNNGQLNLEELEKKLDSNTSAVYIENPTYFGFFEEGVETIAELTHTNESLFVAGVDPISLGIAKSPADYGADIVVGEAQNLGGGLNYGGPSLGLFATKDEKQFLRTFPGRIIGVTEDPEGNRGFAMTLQTREQHIRREKATSNICSNEALCAVATAVYLAGLGRKGLKELAELCFRNANYVMNEINGLKSFDSPTFDSTHFKEFTVRSEKIEKAHTELLKNGIHGGLLLPDLKNTALYCVTESHTKSDIDTLLEVLGNV